MYVSYFMYNKDMGRGKWCCIEKASSWDTVEPSRGFLMENVFLVRRTESWSKAAGSLFSRHLLSAAGTHQLHLHPPFPTMSHLLAACQVYLTCLIDKPCWSQQAFISLLRGVCLLNCTTEPSCPFKWMWSLFSVLTPFWDFSLALVSPGVFSAVASQKRHQVHTEQPQRTIILLTVFLWASFQYIYHSLIIDL